MLVDSKKDLTVTQKKQFVQKFIKKVEAGIKTYKVHFIVDEEHFKRELALREASSQPFGARRLDSQNFFVRFGSNTLTNGAPEAKADERLHLLNYPHDIIPFSARPANAKFPEFLRLYQNGLSLKEISGQMGFPVSTIRGVLIENKVPLRANKKASANDAQKPKRTFWGGIPYGCCVLDGQVIPNPVEVKVIRQIVALWQKGMSFNAIKKWLISQKIPSKTGRGWSDKTVASIIRRYESESKP